MSLVISPDFQHILRVLNTNIDGRRKVMYAITAIPGVGRRFANVVCKKAAVDAHKRAGELTADEVEKLVAIIQNPKQFKIPTWFLNRQKDYKTGKYSKPSRTRCTRRCGPIWQQEDPAGACVREYPRARGTCRGRRSTMAAEYNGVSPSSTRARFSGWAGIANSSSSVSSTFSVAGAASPPARARFSGWAGIANSSSSVVAPAPTTRPGALARGALGGSDGEPVVAVGHGRRPDLGRGAVRLLALGLRGVHDARRGRRARLGHAVPAEAAAHLGHL